MPTADQTADHVQAAKNAAKEAQGYALAAKTAAAQANTEQRRAEKVRKKAENSFWPALSVFVSFLTFLAVAITANIALDNLKQLKRDGRTEFTYRAFQDLTTDLEHLLATDEVVGELTMKLRGQGFSEDEISREMQRYERELTNDRLEKLFNTYFVLYNIKEETSKIISKKRWKSTTEYVCGSIIQSYPEAFSYLDIAVSSAPNQDQETEETRALKELKSCRQ